jgi:hypothetical protein
MSRVLCGNWDVLSIVGCVLLTVSLVQCAKRYLLYTVPCVLCVVYLGRVGVLAAPSLWVVKWAGLLLV